MGNQIDRMEFQAMYELAFEASQKESGHVSFGPSSGPPAIPAGSSTNAGANATVAGSPAANAVAANVPTANAPAANTSAANPNAPPANTPPDGSAAGTTQAALLEEHDAKRTERVFKWTRGIHGTPHVL